MNKIRLILLAVSLGTVPAIAQHEHHMPVKEDSGTMKMINDTTPPHQRHNMQPEHDMGNMSHAFSLNLPMSRNGSGTGWLPDASPMYGVMFHSKKWMYMLHGNIFLRYNNQDFSNKGSRGDSKFDAPNWLMFMGQRKVGDRGLFRFSAMLSLGYADHVQLV